MRPRDFAVGKLTRVRNLEVCVPVVKCFVAFVLGLLPSIAIARDSLEDRTLRSMCARGLAESAIVYAASRMEQEDAPEVKALWLIRMLECHANAALRDATTADQHWQDCEQLAEGFEQKWPTNSRLPWIQWQTTRCKLLKLQLKIANYLATPSKRALRDEALELVRNINQDCETALEDIRRRQPLAARQSVRGGSEAPAEQLNQLLVDTVLLQCEALLVRARLYPPDSTDRVAAATEVKSRAVDVLARTEKDWDSREQLLVAKAVADLELGSADEALRGLGALVRESNNQQVQIRAAMIAVEYFTSQQQASRAQPLVDLLARLEAGPELALAEMQVALADVTQAEGEAKSQQLQLLIEKAKSIGVEFGGYWRNRAEALLAGTTSANDVESSSTVGAELMMVEVRQLLAAGDSAGAVKRLIEFRDRAAASDQGELAIQLASQAAALLQKEGNWRGALDTLEVVVRQFSGASNAADANLLNLWAHSQLLRAQPTDPGTSKGYENAIILQITTWPDSEASDEPQEWLARWLIAKSRRAEFLDVLFRRIELASSTEVVVEGWKRWLGEFLQLPLEEQQTKLEAISAKLQGLSIESTKICSEIAWLYADTVVSWPDSKKTKEQRDELNRLQRALTRRSVDGDGEKQWQELARQLLLAVDLIQRLRLGEASGIDSLAASWDPDVLTSAIRSGFVSAAVGALDEMPANSVVQLITLLRIDSTWQQELAASKDPLVAAHAARILIWQGEITEGLQGLRQLVDANPRDGFLQLQLAHALASGDSNQRAESSRIAARVASSSPAGSDLSLDARWRMFKNQRLAGQHEAAIQSAKLLLATQPGIEGVWKERFGSLK